MATSSDSSIERKNLQSIFNIKAHSGSGPIKISVLHIYVLNSSIELIDWLKITFDSYLKNHFEMSINPERNFSTKFQLNNNLDKDELLTGYPSILFSTFISVHFTGAELNSLVYCTLHLNYIWSPDCMTKWKHNHAIFHDWLHFFPTTLYPRVFEIELCGLNTGEQKPQADLCFAHYTIVSRAN